MSPRRSGCRALPSQGSLAQSSSRASTFQPTAALASPGTQKPLEISTARHMPSLERLLVAGKPCHFDCFQMGIMAEMQNIKEQLQAELQETEARINAREKRLEEEMKIIRETLNPLSQALQKQMYKGSFTKAAAAAAASSTGAFAPQPEKRSPGSRFISSTDTAAAQQQEIKDDSLELLRCIVTTANPMTKYIELENIGSGTFGEVCRALDTATGGEVNVNSAADSAALEGFPLCCELELWVELC
ncbi:hypothetical protein DUI87_22226 [Hirundo rustica rustica]|uniref:Protein kinase domain-containing protein n=1 Tax=Hirundo rustica rustica TaxID=333673 RepID=A0A3M0K2F0_HIRRU|nr:hypothetical protein DUI87_22226 [Hirundo rustica rustica]